MKIPPFFLTVCLVCLLAAAVTIAGCTGTGNRPNQTPQPTPVGTAVPVSHLVVTEEQNKVHHLCKPEQHYHRQITGKSHNRVPVEPHNHSRPVCYERYLCCI